MNDVLHRDVELPPTLRSEQLAFVLSRALPDVRVVEAPAPPEPDLVTRQPEIFEPARRTVASFIPRLGEESILVRWLSPLIARRSFGLS